MLRQLARLTHRLPAVSARACAFAVYADHDGRLIPARESGEEGVACVDDAARGLVLMCRLWRATRLGSARRTADGLLDFVLWMQLPNGDFVNFISDWAGHHNLDGPTSVAGGAFWQARGLLGVAHAWLTLADARAADGFACALERVRQIDVAPDVRAIHAATALEIVRAGRMPPLRADLVRWCDEIASARSGDVLMDSASTGVHLWGHTQEAVLADAGRFLGRAELVEIARRSAEVVFVPVIESGFDLPMVQPYAVTCAVLAMDRLREATGDARYERLARDARAWFDGRNLAHAPVYDRASGRVADGIDDGRVSTNSGAEANLVAAEALFAEVAAAAR